MILEHLFGLSLVLTASLDFQPSASASAGAWMQMSIRQKSATFQPLVRQATDCIVQKMFSDPRFNTKLGPGEINDLIVDSMPACVRPMQAMIDAHDRMYGTGSGEAFLLGPYLDMLPAAVVSHIKILSRDR